MKDKKNENEPLKEAKFMENRFFITRSLFKFIILVDFGDFRQKYVPCLTTDKDLLP